MSVVDGLIDGLNTTGAVPATFWIAASPGSPIALLEQTSPQTVVPYYDVATYFDCRNCHPFRLVQRGWQWWVQNTTPGDSPYLPLARSTPHGVAVRQLLVYPLHGRPVLMPPLITQGFAYLTNRAVDVAVPVSLGGHAYTVARLDAHVRTRVHLTPRAIAVQVQVHAGGIIDDAPPHTLITRALEHAVGLAAAHVIAVRCRDTIDWANRTHTDPVSAHSFCHQFDSNGCHFNPRHSAKGLSSISMGNPHFQLKVGAGFRAFAMGDYRSSVPRESSALQI